MNIAEIAGAVERNAVPVVFVNVLLEQLGLPVPTTSRSAASFTID